MIIGLLVFFINSKNESRDKKLLIGFSILFPFIVFSVAGNKDIRYTLPILVFLVMVVGYCISSLKIPKRITMLSAICVVGILQLSTITFGIPSVLVSHDIYPSPLKPRQEDWQIENILDTLSANIQKTPANVLMLYNHPYMNWRTLEFYAFREKLPLRIYNYEFISSYPSEISNFDFVLYVLDNSFENQTIQQQMLNKANHIFETHISEFKKIKEIELPNSVKIQIYENKK